MPDDINLKPMLAARHQSKADVYSYAASLVWYCPLTGIFRWRHRFGGGAWDKRFNTRYAGNVIGNKDRDGYLLAGVRFEGKDRKVSLHRLAWLITHGSLPECMIDHVNGNPADNRLENLRAVTNQQNQQNVGMLKNNTSGFTGVHWHKGHKKWRAAVKLGRRHRHLGCFDSKEEAAEVAQLARDMLGFSPRHGMAVSDAQRAKGDA